MNNNTTYKDSPMDKIPSGWELKELGEIAKIKHGRDQKLIEVMNGKYPILATGGEIGRTNTPLYSKSSVLIGRKGTINKPKFVNQPFWTVDTLFYTEITEWVLPIWLYFKFETINWYLYNEASGVPSLSSSTISKIKIILPPLPEQTRIAEVLSTWDKAISNVQSTIEQAQLRNKWLMQELLSGRKKLKGFENEKWKRKLLNDILIPVRKPLVPKKDELYQQIGIRSHTKGIFYKEKVTGAILGDKRVFWIEPNCFIVNIVFAWEHAIAKTTEKEIGMIASHRFPMFKTKDKVLDLDYLLYYFKSLKGKHLLGLASPGGAGRNKTLGQSEFMKLQIPVPSLEEQTAIAQGLQVADKEVQLLKSKLGKMKEQKKGLMQVLLTGKKRLNVN